LLLSALQNLCKCLHDNRRFAEAVAAVGEVNDGYRELCESDPDTYLRMLGQSLMDTSAYLAAAGQTAASTAAGLEAIDIGRRLLAADRQHHLPYFTEMLSNYGIHLARTGRYGDAVIVENEVVENFHELAMSDRAVHLPNLAHALQSYGVGLRDVGRLGDAVTVTRAAESHFRELVETNPDVHLPSLMRTLTNLSSLFDELGQGESALSTIAEVVSVSRALVRSDRATHLEDLATSTLTLGTSLRAAGRGQEALDSAREAVAYFRELYETDPGAHLPRLAAALNNLSAFLFETGNAEEALRAAQESVGHRRGLVQSNRGVYLPDLARSLSTLGGCLFTLDRMEEALEIGRESVAYLRELVLVNRTGHLTALASTLSFLSDCLDRTGRADEALRITEEAVECWCEAVDSTPGVHLSSLLIALEACCGRLGAAGRADEIYDRVAAVGTALEREDAATLWTYRATWSTGEPLADLERAVACLDELRFDPAVSGPIRRLIRAAAESTLTEDAMWDRLPGWVSTDIPEPTVDFVGAWLDAPSSTDREALLLERHEQLVAAEAQGSLELMAFLHPEWEDFVILRELAGLLTGMDVDEAVEHFRIGAEHAVLIRTWMATETWEESRRFAIEHLQEIFTEETKLAALSLADPIANQHLAMLKLVDAQAPGTPHDLRAAVNQVYDWVSEPLLAIEAARGFLRDLDRYRLGMLMTASQNFSAVPGIGQFLAAVAFVLNTEPGTEIPIDLIRAAAASYRTQYGEDAAHERINAHVRQLQVLAQHFPDWGPALLRFKEALEDEL
jgi:tetratricopeptide (TPR) repeat protein